MHIGVGRIENAAGGYFGGSIGNSITPGHVQRQLVVNGEVLGRYGEESVTDDHGSVSYGSVAEFTLDTAARPLVSTGSAGDGPVHYTVVGGETLRSIAQTVLGDASLWYLIAQANGLSGASELVAGQSLNIPMVALSHNNSTTFQPYDPSKIVGDTSPVLPMPAGGDNGCGAFGQVIQIVIIAAVTYFTAGAASVWLGAAPGVVTAGGAALAAAAGSVAGQTFGIAAGMQEGFDIKQVALSALSAGVTYGLVGPTPLGSEASAFANAAARAAIGNALTQGIGVVTGLQRSFNWTAVAASGIGAGVGEALGESIMGAEQMGPTRPGETLPRIGGLVQAWGGSDGAQFAGRALLGLAAGTATAVARGGRIAVQQIAADAFGNALGGAFVDNIRTSGTQEDRLGNFIQQNQDSWDQRHDRYDQIVGAFSNYNSANAAGGVLVASARDKLKLDVTNDSDEDLYSNIIGKLQARDAQRQAAGTAFAAQSAQATSNLYANGAGDIHDTSPAPGLQINPDTGLADFRFTSQQLLRAQAMGVANMVGSAFDAGGSPAPSMAQQVAQVAFQAAVQAATDLVTTPLDLLVAAGGATYTAVTGRAADLPMFSGIGQAAQAGATAPELLTGMNPVYTGMVAGYEVAHGNPLPLAAFGGGLVGGAVVGRGIMQLPGYQAGSASLTGAAAQRLQAMGVPDWNIGLATPQPGTLYSNPIPVMLERVGANTSNALANLSESTASRVNQYAELVKSNKPWSWSDIGEGIGRTERQQIRNYAQQSGLIPSIPVDPVTNFADFRSVVIREVPLPESHWPLSDRQQFNYLDDLIGGRPTGTTWHHDVEPGNMQLVPFGVHNITSHSGGRTVWSLGER